MKRFRRRQGLEVRRVVRENPRKVVREPPAQTGQVLAGQVQLRTEKTGADLTIGIVPPI
jgi:hypothetical protein